MKTYRCYAQTLLSKAVILLLSLSPILSFAQIKYPASDKCDQVDEYFHIRIADPYRWLEDPNSPATKNWIKAQNDFTEAYLDSIPYREALRRRLEQVNRYPIVSAPSKNGDYYYYYKSDGNQDRRILYRYKSQDSPEEVVIDPNKIEPAGRCSLIDLAISGNAQYAAYTISRDGSDFGEICVMDLNTLRILPDHIRNVKLSNICWQGRGFYYCQFPAIDSDKILTAVNLNQKVWYHSLGSAHDSLVYYDSKLPQQTYGIRISRDEKYLFLEKRISGGSSILTYNPIGTKIFIPIFRSTKSYGEYVGGDSRWFFVLTNSELGYGKVIRHNIETGENSSLIPEKRHAIENVTVGGGKIFVRYQKDVNDHVAVYNWSGDLESEVTLPDHGTVSGFAGSPGDTALFYTFTSFTSPTTIYQYHIAKRQSTVYHATESNFDWSGYEVRQIFYRAPDNTRIPLYVVSKKGLPIKTARPLILYGYGGFGLSSKSFCDPSLIPFLEAGGVYAVAGIRGGGEYGGHWHALGAGAYKLISFKDFLKAARFLIHKKYTDREHLAIRGASNGGLLVTACANMRPTLFKAVIAEVPVTDMLRFDKFTIGRHLIGEYGDPEIQPDFFNLFVYSPLHSIVAGRAYPATLVCTADHDDRAVPAHAYKYIATMQNVAGPSTPSPLLIRIAKDNGHQYGNLSKDIEEETDIYAFIFRQLGMKPVNVGSQ